MVGHCETPFFFSRCDVERAQTAADLFDKPICCLDPFFSSRLRDLFEGAAELLASQALLGALRAWLRCGKVTIGHIERLHAEAKSTFATNARSRRHVESAIYAGHLNNLMAWHVKRGRLNFALSKHAAAFAQRSGLCLNRQRVRRKVRTASGSKLVLASSEQKQRGRFGFGSSAWKYVVTKSKAAKMMRGGVRWSRRQESAARQAWRQEWQDTTAEQRRSWEQLHMLDWINSVAPPARQIQRDLLDVLMEAEDADAEPEQVEGTSLPIAARASQLTWEMTHGHGQLPHSQSTCLLKLLAVVCLSGVGALHVWAVACGQIFGKKCVWKGIKLWPLCFESLLSVVSSILVCAGPTMRASFKRLWRWQAACSRRRSPWALEALSVSTLVATPESFAHLWSGCATRRSLSWQSADCLLTTRMCSPSHFSRASWFLKPAMPSPEMQHTHAEACMRLP